MTERESEPFEDVGSGVHPRPIDSQMAVATLAAVLDAFDAPALLLDPSGSVLHRNDAARAEGVVLPPDIQLGNGKSAAGCTVRPIEVLGRAFSVVVLRIDAAPTKQTPRPALREGGWGLSPSLARVAEHAVRGLSDKEIAQETGHSLATVRVYVSRIYRHLGVHNRVELTQYAFANVPRAS